MVVIGAGTPNAPKTTSSAEGPLDAVAPDSIVPTPANLAGNRDGGNVAFTLENPAPVEGDVFMWRPVSVIQTGDYTTTSEPRPVVAASPDAQACLEVVIRRCNGQATPELAKACVP